MKLGGFDTGPFEHHMSDGFDPHHAFVSLMPRYVDLARDAARTQAVSHRDFHVGAVLYAGNDSFSKVGMLDGANVKPTESHPKYCAEMSVIDQAQALGFSRVLGVVVAGTSNPDKIKSVSGVATPTLHPCSECRGRMADSGLFEPSSLVVTVSTEEDLYQVHTYEEMVCYWESPDEAGAAPVLPYDADLWQWRQATYGRNLAEIPNSQPWQLAKLALVNTVGTEA